MCGLWKIDNSICPQSYLLYPSTPLIYKQHKTTPLASILKKCDETGSDDSNLREFLDWFPILRKGYLFYFMDNVHEAISYQRTVMNLLINDVPIAEKITPRQIVSLTGRTITISFVVDETTDESVEYTVFSSMLFKWLCRDYSRGGNLSLKSTRFSFEGKLLFLSSVGKKTLQELGLKDGSIIQVSVSPNSDQPPKDTTVESNKSKSKSSKSKNKKRKNNTKKKKTVVPNNLYEVVSEEEMHRREHSKAISKVLEEAERTKFKAIRQQLNNMNLERTNPKSRMARAKPPVIIDNPLTSGVGGKAGKSYTLVQVGEESSLYKTSKPLSNRNGRSASHLSAGKAIAVDLRGLTKGNALAKLDETLPDLVSKAMRGEYPFLVLVKIIHGGGSQILAEAVAGWIKQNKQVANAPKSMC